MIPRRFMIIAGETSGDMLAAELVRELRRQICVMDEESSASNNFETHMAPIFFGAGGPHMAGAGVKLEFDLTQHSVVGLSEVIKKYFTFKKFMDRLVQLAVDEQPEVIICVDFSGFNRRFAAAVKNLVRSQKGEFHNWSPGIIQYISPQVWASREDRVYQMARDYDMVLSIFPFEKEWYAQRVPQLKVEFVGHPLKDRHQGLPLSNGWTPTDAQPPRIVLLPGSRRSELRLHLPVVLKAFGKIRSILPTATAKLVLPNSQLSGLAVQLMQSSRQTEGIERQVGGLAQTLGKSHLAIASTGTVTMECAYFGVPSVTLYKTSGLTYQVGKRLIRVKSLTMPNLLADETLFPEFIQHQATPENIAEAALSLLQNPKRLELIRAKLASLMETLGQPGAAGRAARLILNMASARMPQ